MKIGKLILAGVVALSLSAASAQAALVDLTWSGTATGNDGLGLFGDPAFLSGVAYTATYRFDTGVGFSQNNTSGSDQVEGGSVFDPDQPIPLISASLTINGMTFDVDGDYYSLYFRQSGEGASNISTLAQREIDGNPAPFGGELFQRVFRVGNFYGRPLDQPGVFDFTASDNPGGHFSFFNKDAMGNLSGPNTDLSIVPDHLVVALAPSGGVVPEPATWAMMVIGFGLLGGAIRRRRAELGGLAAC
jgi:hypothetical protein